MIFKSYIVEKDILKLENFLAILFYGENLGLKDDFKDLIKKRFDKSEQISFQQNDLIKNPSLLDEQTLNTSLFSKKKLIIIHDFSDKLKKIVIEAVEKIDQNTKIVLFSENLDKKSSTRAAFEKEKTLAIVPCYKDNEKTLSIYVREKLEGYQGLTQEIVNFLIKNSDTDRKIIKSEIEKIKGLFIDKKIVKDKIIDLINNPSNIDFDNLKNSCLEGNKLDLNKNLSNISLQNEKSYFYLANLTTRIDKLKILNDLVDKYKNVDSALDLMRPKIFWKDMPIFKKQLKIWNKNKIKKANKLILTNEMLIKTRLNNLSNVLIKKMLIELCEIAGSNS